MGKSVKWNEIKLLLYCFNELASIMITENRWIVAQIGSREYYNFAVALNNYGKLHIFITDLWLDHNNYFVNLLISFFPSAASRFNQHLPRTKVKSFNFRCLIA